MPRPKTESPFARRAEAVEFRLIEKPNEPVCCKCGDLYPPREHAAYGSFCEECYAGGDREKRSHLDGFSKAFLASLREVVVEEISS